VIGLYILFGGIMLFVSILGTMDLIARRRERLEKEHSKTSR
jgi:hypothetical protein